MLKGEELFFVTRARVIFVSVVGSLNPKLWAAKQFIVPEVSLGDLIDNQEMVTRCDALDDVENEADASESEADDIEE